jgi:hypothetical protein
MGEEAESVYEVFEEAKMLVMASLCLLFCNSFVSFFGGVSLDGCTGFGYIFVLLFRAGVLMCLHDHAGSFLSLGTWMR